MSRYAEYKNITATITIWNGQEYEKISKEFEVELRPFNKLYNPDLIDWVLSENRRVSNLMTVTADGKEYTYSI